ncbi:nuclear transport factor 2 family protein [Hymenobacter sp. B81]|uniref:nuclear transport factor 2 family protein n=1 Tax=Hymenobacter sp. B81 TaxID=3344878 RepID=UPI0037DBF595
MQRLLMLAFLLVLTTTSGLRAQTAVSKKNRAAQQQMEALERQRFAAQVSKDYALLERVLADDLVYIHGSGKQNGKPDYIQSIRDGQSRYDRIDVEALHVRAYNDGRAAVVNGIIVITTLPATPDAAPSRARFKYVVVQIKDPRKGWQVVTWQSQKQADPKS